jgi:hypothetical protein
VTIPTKPTPQCSQRFPSSSRAPTWISAFHCTPKQTKLHQFRSLDNIQETDTKQETDNKKARPFVRTKAFVNFKSKTVQRASYSAKKEK